jgi:hypothetical protein
MFRATSHYFRFVLALTALTFSSACTAKKTTFDKTLDNSVEHSSVKNVPQKSPEPGPSQSPAPFAVIPPTPIQSITPTPVKPPTAPAPKPIIPPKAPPVTPTPPVIPAPPAPPARPVEISSIELAGNYISAEDFVMHTQALSALSASASVQKICKIEREGSIDSVNTDGAAPKMQLSIRSEKFSGAQSGGANDDFCAEIGKSFAEAHTFSVPILDSGKGFLVLSLDEASSDGVSLTTSQGLLSGIFFDQDSTTDITAPLFQILAGNYVGSFGGGFIADAAIPRITLGLDSKSQKFSLIDNECAFSITATLTATGSSGSVLLKSEKSLIKAEALTTAAAKNYSVYFGRHSGGCTQREQNLITQLTSSGVLLEQETGKYALDFSMTGGSGSKYAIRSN